MTEEQINKLAEDLYIHSMGNGLSWLTEDYHKEDLKQIFKQTVEGLLKEYDITPKA